MALTNSAALWHERNAAQPVALCRIVRIASHDYQIRRAGPADAALQSNGAGGYDIIIGGSNDGRIAIIGNDGRIY